MGIRKHSLFPLNYSEVDNVLRDADNVPVAKLLHGNEHDVQLFKNSADLLDIVEQYLDEKLGTEEFNGIAVQMALSVYRKAGGEYDVEKRLKVFVVSNEDNDLDDVMPCEHSKDGYCIRDEKHYCGAHECKGAYPDLMDSPSKPGDKIMLIDEPPHLDIRPVLENTGEFGFTRGVLSVAVNREMELCDEFKLLDFQIEDITSNPLELEEALVASSQPQFQNPRRVAEFENSVIHERLAKLNSKKQELLRLPKSQRGELVEVQTTINRLKSWLR